jgi:hypothetical protein
MSRLGIALALWFVGASIAADERKPVDKTAEIEAVLETPVEMQYLCTPLGDMVADLKLRYQLNIELDGEALAAEGKGSDLPICKTLKDVPLASALDLVLNGQYLVWVIHNDVLLITNAESEAKYAQTKVYVVGDLDEHPEMIGNIIVQSLAPETWRNNGGTVGSIAPFEKGRALVITHTSRMHRRIAKLLGDLRAANTATAK